LLAVLAAVLFLVAMKDQGFGSLSQADYASIAFKIVLLAVIGSVALSMFRERFAAALRSALIWVVIALLLAVGYTYRFELQETSDRLLAEFVPGHVATRGHTVLVARSSGGGFSVAAQINGEVLTYTINVETANGRARAAPVTLDRLAIGGIVERSVPALVAQPGQLHTSLLGMSFLSRLESLEVHGDQLLLRGYP